MSAEEHVEPFGLVSGCGARGGSPGRSGCACRSRSCGDKVRSAQSRGDKVRCSSARGNRAGEAAEQCAGRGRSRRLPVRLSKSLCRCVARRRSGAAVPGEEQGEGLCGLPAGCQRCHRRHRRTGRDGDRCAGCCCSRARTSAAGAAADAAARRTVRHALGVRRRRPNPLQRRCARRWPHHAMPGGAERVAVARMQGCAGAIRRAVSDLRRR